MRIDGSSAYFSFDFIRYEKDFNNSFIIIESMEANGNE